MPGPYAERSDDYVTTMIMHSQAALALFSAVHLSVRVDLYSGTTGYSFDTPETGATGASSNGPGRNPKPKGLPVDDDQV